ncbi:Transforming growth factor beta-1-induced transcript 1 protein [Coemansia sp. RSA 1813]|nr:Transforming growth factor beta-1-induced transcript 1 protein [Coemansia sp. RSA 1646]KAJ1771575.1 Transforming growth factor beta-1-induced transcript 1 protein [Coemansia sp. RSA 1843]KAJ2089565.1 Transforming growth factor beta-1-induced transcript 1 protein [Coemansia sp. RSA 986]KAJ2214667.1 Transforming growth factor beta-1-induced transcript 1 protein [Coemansia sp. RSA 487]KAJ2571586.1 Transforming growth factor beta-1-induced transcript 1 protein [Coemansia sp. RSA 1813]
MSDSVASELQKQQKHQLQVQQSNMAAFLNSMGQSSADVQIIDNSKPLAEALRNGDRETIEAIVQKLTGQLESLKMESLLSSQIAALGLQGASASASGSSTPKDGEERQRRRQSLFPAAPHSSAFASSGDLETVSQDRRKRATVAINMDAPIASTLATDVVCAYCGTTLDDVPDTAMMATLNSEIGYCCSNCENILSLEASSDEQPTTPLPNASASMSATIVGSEPHRVNISASQIDSDYVSLDAFNIDDDADSEYFDALTSNSRRSRGHCNSCREPLGEEYVNVLGRRFHAMHFVCDDCSIPLYALGGYLQDPNGGDKFYCQRDYLQRFSPACHACSVQITSGEMAVALGRTYHSDCFVCSICQSPFIGDVCFEHDSQPLCEWHWYIQNGLLCTECGGIIKNQCVLTRGKKYHQACAEAKYGEPAVTFDEARRLIKSGKANAIAGSASTVVA